MEGGKGLSAACGIITAIAIESSAPRASSWAFLAERERERGRKRNTPIGNSAELLLKLQPWPP